MKWSLNQAIPKFQDGEYSEVVFLMYRMIVGVVNGACDSMTFTPTHFHVYKNNRIIATREVQKPYMTESYRTAFDLILLRDDVMRRNFRLVQQLPETTVYQVIQATEIPLEHP